MDFGTQDTTVSIAAGSQLQIELLRAANPSVCAPQTHKGQSPFQADIEMLPERTKTRDRKDDARRTKVVTVKPKKSCSVTEERTLDTLADPSIGTLMIPLRPN